VGDRRSRADARHSGHAYGELVISPEPDPIACLLDQRTVRIRHATADDAPRIAVFLRSLGRRPDELERFRSATRRQQPGDSIGEGDDRLALLAETLDGTRLVGCAAYRLLLYGHRAEAAVAVAGNYRTAGLPRVLLVQLARKAEQHGIPVLLVQLGSDEHQLVDQVRDEFRVREASAAATGHAELVLRRGRARETPVQEPTAVDPFSAPAPAVDLAVPGGRVESA
jgi:N-acetylglutamate synthase-like GNAT family acetyltransferase